MLAGADGPAAAPMPELDEVLARLARESGSIQDADDGSDIGLALSGAAW